VPMAAGQALLALDDLLGPAYEIVVVDGPSRDGSAASAAVLRALHERFLPAKVVARRPADAKDSSLPACLRPLLDGKRSLDGQTTLYVCQRGTCQAPVAGLPAIEERLRTL